MVDLGDDFFSCFSPLFLFLSLFSTMIISPTTRFALYIRVFRCRRASPGVIVFCPRIDVVKGRGFGNGIWERRSEEVPRLFSACCMNPLFLYRLP